jgi:putative MFS transporter
VTPAFLFLAACGLAIGLAFTLLGVETHGKPLALDKVEAPAPEAAALAMREQTG